MVDEVRSQAGSVMELSRGIADAQGRLESLEKAAKNNTGTSQAQSDAFDPWARAREARQASARTQSNQMPGADRAKSPDVGTQYFSTATPQREKAPYDPNWRLDGKVAALPTYQYCPKDTAAWLLKVRNYFIGKCPDLEYLLRWAESFQHKEITQAQVKDCGLALDVDPVQASQRIWTWLQLPLMGSGTPELDYNNAEALNGMEVWRCLAVPLASKSLPRRFALRDKVQNPKQCSSFAAVLEQLKTWQKDLVAYVAAGGAMPSDEDKRYQLMKMLPGNLSLEMRTKANDHQTLQGLKDWSVAQDESNRSMEARAST